MTAQIITAICLGSIVLTQGYFATKIRDKNFVIDTFHRPTPLVSHSYHPSQLKLSQISISKQSLLPTSRKNGNIFSNLRNLISDSFLVKSHQSNTVLRATAIQVNNSPSSTTSMNSASPQSPRTSLSSIPIIGPLFSFIRLIFLAFQRFLYFIIRKNNRGITNPPVEATIIDVEPAPAISPIVKTPITSKKIPTSTSTAQGIITKQKKAIEDKKISSAVVIPAIVTPLEVAAVAVPPPTTSIVASTSPSTSVTATMSIEETMHDLVHLRSSFIPSSVTRKDDVTVPDTTSTSRKLVTTDDILTATAVTFSKLLDGIRWNADLLATTIDSVGAKKEEVDAPLEAVPIPPVFSIEALQGSWEVDIKCGKGRNVGLGAIMDIHGDSSISMDSENIHGIRWQAVVEGDGKHHVEYLLQGRGEGLTAYGVMATGDDVLLLKGSIIGPRVLGSVFTGLGAQNIYYSLTPLNPDSSISLTPVEDSWWYTAKPLLQKVGTFQMKKTSPFEKTDPNPSDEVNNAVFL